MNCQTVQSACGLPLRKAFAAKLFEMDRASGEVRCPLPTSDTPHVVGDPASFSVTCIGELPGKTEVFASRICFFFVFFVALFSAFRLRTTKVLMRRWLSAVGAVEPQARLCKTVTSRTEHAGPSQSNCFNRFNRTS